MTRILFIYGSFGISSPTRLRVTSPGRPVEIVPVTMDLDTLVIVEAVILGRKINSCLYFPLTLSQNTITIVVLVTLSSTLSLLLLLLLLQH
jgi:hypothetical protein